jgi:hypothetical protein
LQLLQLPTIHTYTYMHRFNASRGAYIVIKTMYFQDFNCCSAVFCSPTVLRSLEWKKMRLFHFAKIGLKVGVGEMLQSGLCKAIPTCRCLRMLLEPCQHVESVPLQFFIVFQHTLLILLTSSCT